MKSLFVLGLTLISLSALANNEDVDCNKAISTIEINYCAGLDLEQAQQEQEQYLNAAYEFNAGDPQLISTMKIAQQDWQKYLSSHCDSIYTKWREGTIRGVMAISCETSLTKQRTYEIWSQFLTFMDSTPPVLPEPKK